MQRRARKFCGQGHLMDELNTYIHENSRHCKTCRKINSRERARREREKIKAEKALKSSEIQNS